jgi:hypothetical protein
MAVLDDFTGTVAILISSCDAFFDAWRPFVRFFEKFWSDCPLEVFLLTNRLNISSTRIHPIAVGEDRGWSSNLLVALERIPYPYLLYFQEDYFLTRPVAREQLAEDFAQAIYAEVDSLCFRARASIDPGFQPLNDRFGVVPLASDGRTRCQVTLWKREALQSILRPNETAWDFEARGSARTQTMQILSYLRRENTPIPYLMSAISRGLWTPEAIALCREQEVEIDSPFRPTLTTNSWQRRWRRMSSRARLQRALRKQRDRMMEL